MHEGDVREVHVVSRRDDVLADLVAADPRVFDDVHVVYAVVDDEVELECEDDVELCAEDVLLLVAEAGVPPLHVVADRLGVDPSVALLDLACDVDACGGYDEWVVFAHFSAIN